MNTLKYPQFQLLNSDRTKEIARSDGQFLKIFRRDTGICYVNLSRVTQSNITQLIEESLLTESEHLEWCMGNLSFREEKKERALPFSLCEFGSKPKIQTNNGVVVFIPDEKTNVCLKINTELDKPIDIFLDGVICLYRGNLEGIEELLNC